MENNKTDPLAEAEVCIAYGRLEQAAQVLREAIEREPNRKDLWDKLAEIIRRKPSVGSSPTVSFKGSSGYSMDADGTEVFKVGRVSKIIWFIVSVVVVFLSWTAYTTHSKSPWELFLIIDILYILFIINILVHSVRLTKDQMIVSSILRNRTFIYTEIGKVYCDWCWLGRRYCINVYNKQGKHVLIEMFVDYPDVLAASLQRRTYGAVYDRPLRNLPKSIVILVFLIIFLVLIVKFFGT